MAQAYSLLVAGLGDRIEAFLVPVLDGQGYTVRTAIGRAALLGTMSRAFDLVLLNLPSSDELAQLVEVRAACPSALLIIGPARNDKLIVAALEQGADDYVQRPFRTDELLARIRAQLRRQTRAAPPQATFGSLQINLDARHVSHAGQPLALNAEEFALLATLAAQPGFCHPASFLIEQIWGRGQAGDLTPLAVAVARLRTLIEENPAAPLLLGGQPSTGYWLGAPADLRASNARS